MAAALRNRDLRRLLIAATGSTLGNWGYFIALFLYAYDNGGAAAVGLVTVIRMIPAALASPLTAGFADRFDRKRVMIVSDLLRAAFMVSAGALIWADAPAIAVYVFVALTTVTGTAFAPAQAAALPSLARSPAELTAANVSFSTLYETISFIGPALGGLLLVVMSIPLVFVVNGVSFLWSAAVLLGLHLEKTRTADEADTDADGANEAGALESGRFTEVTAGLRAISGSGDLRLLVGLYTAQTFVAGALDVLIVVMALDLLGAGEGAIGYLNAAVGIGGLIGGFVALALAARARLASDFGIGVALFGLPLVLVGIVVSTPVALVALAVIGLGNALVDINALTIMQRTVPDDVLGRALGVLDGVLLGAIGIGALITPALLHLLGNQTVLIVVGLSLPVLALAAGRRLRLLDRGVAPEHLDLLRGIAMLEALPEAALERLARSVGEIRLPAGSVVINEGDHGDLFYVIGAGTVDVAGKTLGVAASFGEIALLRDVPRTATVTARTDVVLYTLARDLFVAAVTGHAPAQSRAEAVIASHLGGPRFDRGQLTD